MQSTEAKANVPATPAVIGDSLISGEIQMLIDNP